MYALVTGASAGIGKEMVYLLAERGYHVILVARRRERLDEIASTLPYGGTVIVQDLAAPNSAQALWDTCQEKELAVEVLINNAGFGKVASHVDVCPAEIERIVAEYPALEKVDTYNADSNEPMLNINVEMGFRPVHISNTWQGPLATVRERFRA